MTGYLLEVARFDGMFKINFLFIADIEAKTPAFKKYQTDLVTATLVFSYTEEREFSKEHFPEGLLLCNKSSKALTVPFGFLPTVGIYR